MLRQLKNILRVAPGIIAAGWALWGRKAPSAKEGGAAGDQGLAPRRRTLGKYFVLFLVVLGIGGFLVVAAGIVPFKASSGHWAVTRWLLHFSMQRSVATHSIGIKAPPLATLDDPDLVLKGAGHYDSGCRFCHGSPELRHPRVTAAMTPQPPYLPSQIPEWEPKELFYIVKYGVKFTGMPAWPAQNRDDEVWAMVAFLRVLPELDAVGYQELVSGNPGAAGPDAPADEVTAGVDVPLAVTESCGRCHRGDGLGRGEGAFPRLAGQRPSYLFASLWAYARGERYSGMMEPVAARLSREEMWALARYYGGLEGVARLRSIPQTTAAAVERGKRIAHQGIPREGVPSCVDCHGPSPTPRNPFYPLLAGQYADYLVLQLELFTREQRGGSPYAHLMRSTAHRLTPEQMRDVAHYYASLPLAVDPILPAD